MDNDSSDRKGIARRDVLLSGSSLFAASALDGRGLGHRNQQAGQRPGDSSQHHRCFLPTRSVRSRPAPTYTPIR